MNTSYKNILEEEIVKGNLIKVIVLLKPMFKYNKEKYNELLVLELQINKIYKEKRLGILSNNNEENRIAHSLIEIINGNNSGIKDMGNKSPSKRYFLYLGCILISFLSGMLAVFIGNKKQVKENFKYRVVNANNGQGINNTIISIYDGYNLIEIEGDSMGYCEHGKAEYVIFKAIGYSYSDTIKPYNYNNQTRRIELKPTLSLTLNENELIKLLDDDAIINRVSKNSEYVDILTKKEFIDYLAVPIVYIENTKILYHNLNSLGLVEELTIQISYPDDLLIHKSYGE